MPANPATDHKHELRYRYQHAAIVGAALRGELGVERQLLAMSALYHELRAEGRIEEAKALKEQARAIHAAAQVAEVEAQIAAVLDEMIIIFQVELDHAASPAEQATWRRKRNAAAKARDRFAAGVRLASYGSGYTAPSASRPHAAYHLYRAGQSWRCSCESHSFCWHQALATAYTVAQGAPAQPIRRAA